MFPNLKTVKVGFADIYNTDGTIKTPGTYGYEYLASFDEFLYNLFTKTNVIKDSKGSFTFCDKTFTYSSYAAAAAKVYNYMSLSSAKSDLTFGASIKDNFRIQFNSISNNSATFKLPAIIDVGEYYDGNGVLQASGKMQLVGWKSISSYLTLSDYTYTGRTMNIRFSGDSEDTVLTEGTTLTSAQFKQLLNNSTFRDYKLMGYSDCYITATVSNISSNLSKVEYITAILDIDGYCYEKTYVINNNVTGA